MFNSNAISTALGIIFIFLLYSLLATILQEIFAKWLRMRERVLVKIVRRMLESQEYGSGNAFVDYYKDILESIVNYFAPIPDKYSFTKAFYCHPAIKQLGENRLSTKPAYITADVFAQVMIELLRGEVYDNTEKPMELIRKRLWDNQGKEQFRISDDTRKTLKALWTDAHEDLQQFTVKLELWYSRVQERGTSWYKQGVQTMLFVIGLGLACAFNVDAIAIARILSKDKDAQENMMKLVESRHKDYGEIIDTVYSCDSNTCTKVVIQDDSVARQLYGRLSEDAAETQAILGLGWKNSDTDKVKFIAALDTLQQTLNLLKSKGDTSSAAYIAAFNRASGDIYNSVSGSRWVHKYQQNYIGMLLGWVITALAISLGAPFWFDLLNKVMVLRGAGKKPEEPKALSGDNTGSPKRVG